MLFQLIGFALAFLLSFLLVPRVKNLGFKLKIVDLPNYRKMHDEPTPCTGGIAIYITFFVTLFLLLLFSPLSSIVELKRLIGLFVCSTAIVLLGLYDDKKNLRPNKKLLGQIIIATVAFIFGFRIEMLCHPLFGSIYFQWFSFPLTLIWFLGFINMINLIDGLDGLACGIVFIISSTLFVLGICSGNEILTFLSAILSGTTLAFFYFNLCQEKIFLGDNGSMLLGFLIAALPIIGLFGQKSPTETVFISTILCAGILIYDTLSAIIRRLKNNNPIFKADQAHIHHRLLAKGFSPRQVVLILCGITVLLGLGGLMFTTSRYLWIGIIILLVSGIIFALKRIKTPINY